MFVRRPILVVIAVGILSSTAVAGEGRAVDNWPHWRGPLSTGEAPSADPPVEWSEVDNVRWKIELPGLGHSTPVVWEDRVYVTAAVPFGERVPPRWSGAPGAHDNVPVTSQHRFVAIAINRRDGTVVWQKTLGEALPHEGGHYTASLASHSPVTDGRLIFAFFGSHGLYCLDRAGSIVWKKDLGKQNTKHGHGEGSSPCLYGDTLVVNWDHEGQSFVVAYEKDSGHERWKVHRNEVTSWASPIVVAVEGKPQVVISGTDRVRAYDLSNGEVIWECGGLSANIVASPVSNNEMVFAGSSYEKRALLAIRLAGARGDITQTDRLVWQRMRGTPYVPSPLLYKDSLYFLRHYQGILTRVDAQTGRERLKPVRLGPIRNVYASPVGAADRIYVTGIDGATIVIRHGDDPDVLAVNRLNDVFSASAALAGRELFLRGRQKLYCIAED